ncbi:hypothetical protein C1645_836293 [Glomus cerebriforme]|uniref:Uncharacterized protein n=1 Tax=Glomus cerebriforme TaxID=658196 RepID=A0A397SC11_9GLOM|nr:hypothetical protein C1645_836293 [Glomus cerebriforme]
MKGIYSVEHPQSRNSEKSSFEIPSDENAKDPKNDEEIKFDLADILIELKKEPTCKIQLYSRCCSIKLSEDEHTLDGVLILNSEIKPIGHTSLQQKKDRLKAQLKAQKLINLQLHTKRGPEELIELFFMDLQYDGLYHLWPFLTTRLVTNKITIPLAESAIGFKKLVGKILENYKYQKHLSGETTPPAQVSFMHKLSESPQVKKLIH